MISYAAGWHIFDPQSAISPAGGDARRKGTRVIYLGIALYVIRRKDIVIYPDTITWINSTHCYLAIAGKLTVCYYVWTVGLHRGKQKLF